MIDSQSRVSGAVTGMFGGSKSFASEYKITFVIRPEPPKGGADNDVLVTVADRSGNPVVDARVRVTVIMPAMPQMGMPEMRAGADLSWDGTAYTGKLKPPSAGSWNVVVEVRRGGQVVASYRGRFDAS